MSDNRLKTLSQLVAVFDAEDAEFRKALWKLTDLEANNH